MHNFEPTWCYHSIIGIENIFFVAIFYLYSSKKIYFETFIYYFFEFRNVTRKAVLLKQILFESELLHYIYIVASFT